MMREAINNYLAFFLVLLVCGGGCMSLPYVPAKQMELDAVGLDDHTRARLLGQADPRPSDPEPTTGFGGRLAVVPLGTHWDGYYGPTADISPGEDALGRLAQFDGVEQAFLAFIDFTDIHEARRRGEEPPTIDLHQKLLGLAELTKADLLLVYTTGHRAKSFDLTLGVGQILLLGFCPTVVFSAEADTTALLMDAKTGYIYAMTAGEGGGAAMGIGWGRAGNKAEAASRAAENSFDDIVDQFEEAWPVLRGLYP